MNAVDTLAIAQRLNHYGVAANVVWPYSDTEDCYIKMSVDAAAVAVEAFDNAARATVSS